MIAFGLGAPTGFGFRWVSEPEPTSVKEFKITKRKLESATAQLKDRNEELRRARKAQSDAEKTVAELKANQTADPQKPAKAPAPSAHRGSQEPPKSAPCDLTTGNKDLAPQLKECLQAFAATRR